MRCPVSVRPLLENVGSVDVVLLRIFPFRQIRRADFEKIADKLPSGYNYKNAGIYSVDEVSDNGVITHKIILDLNNNGKQEAKDVVLESFVTYRAGYTGTITDKVEISNSRVTTYNKPASSTYGGRMTGAQK